MKNRQKFLAFIAVPAIAFPAVATLLAPVVIRIIEIVNA